MNTQLNNYHFYFESSPCWCKECESVTGNSITKLFGICNCLNILKNNEDVKNYYRMLNKCNVLISRKYLKYMMNDNKLFNKVTKIVYDGIICDIEEFVMNSNLINDKLKDIICNNIFINKINIYVKNKDNNNCWTYWTMIKN